MFFTSQSMYFCLFLRSSSRFSVFGSDDSRKSFLTSLFPPWFLNFLRCLGHQIFSLYQYKKLVSDQTKWWAFLKKMYYWFLLFKSGVINCFLFREWYLNNERKSLFSQTRKETTFGKVTVHVKFISRLLCHILIINAKA